MVVEDVIVKTLKSVTRIQTCGRVVIHQPGHVIAKLVQGRADEILSLMCLARRSPQALSALISEKKPIVGISFGNPYLLQSFKGLRTYIVSYGDMPALQQAAARA